MKLPYGYVLLDRTPAFPSNIADNGHRCSGPASGYQVRAEKAGALAGHRRKVITIDSTGD
ncbi:MAG TPA: hypothetical protein VGM64_07075 [Lacunisphaera sp.]